MMTANAIRTPSTTSKIFPTLMALKQPRCLVRARSIRVERIGKVIMDEACRRSKPEHSFGTPNVNPDVYSMNTPVAVLLSRKGSNVQTAAPSDTVADAVRVMNEKKIGSLVVVEGSRVVGIFTERDVLSRVVAAERDPCVTRVSAVMTPSVATIGISAT